MKPKRYATGLLATSIVLSVIMTLGTILQFGDYYYAVNAGASTPQSITDRLQVQNSMDSLVIAGLRNGTSDVGSRLKFSPLILVAIVPLILCAFVCFYDRRTALSGLGKIATSFIILELMVMVVVYAVVTAQHT